MSSFLPRRQALSVCTATVILLATLAALPDRAHGQQAITGTLDSEFSLASQWRDNILRKSFTHGAVGLSQHGKDVWATQVFSAAHGYLVAGVPSRIGRGDCVRLEVDPYPESAAAAVRFELFSPETNARVIDASPLGNMVIDVAPGSYTLRFHFPKSARLFSVVRGPILRVE